MAVKNKIKTPAPSWKNNASEKDMQTAWEIWRKYERPAVSLFLKEHIFPNDIGEWEDFDNLEEDEREEIFSNLTPEEIEYLKESPVPRTLDNVGLGFDYVEWENDGYFRFQFSTGGPGTELRFYTTPLFTLTKAEYVYLDWNEGVGFDVTDDPVVRAFWNYLSEFAPEALREYKEYMG